MCHGARTRLAQTNSKARGSADWDASKLRASCGPPLRARCPLGKGHAKAHVPRRDRVPERHQWSTIHPYYMQPLPRSRPLNWVSSSVWSGRHSNGAGVFMFGHCAVLLWLAGTPSRAFKSATAGSPRRCRKTLNIKSENRHQWASAAPRSPAKADQDCRNPVSVFAMRCMTLSGQLVSQLMRRSPRCSGRAGPKGVANG